MLYKRQIYDQVTIQYIILFTMASANRVVTHDQLTTIVLDNCNIMFTDFRIALDNLEKIGYLRLFCPDEKLTYCELLPKGVEANGFFYKKIPIYIREPIEEYIEDFFEAETQKTRVKAELLPLNLKEYMADFAIYDGKTPLITLSLYAGTRKYAQSMIRAFKKDPQKVYETVLELLGNEEEKDEDEDVLTD